MECTHKKHLMPIWAKTSVFVYVFICIKCRNTDALPLQSDAPSACRCRCKQGLCWFALCCWVASVQQVYLSFSTGNICLLQLETTLIRGQKLNWNSNVLLNSSHSKCVVKPTLELEKPERNCGHVIILFDHSKWHRSPLQVVLGEVLSFTFTFTSHCKVSRVFTGFYS